MSRIRGVEYYIIIGDLGMVKRRLLTIQGKYMDLAALYGQLEVMKYLRERDCPWGEETCENAASFGSIDIFKWLKEQGYPWDDKIFAVAAYHGNIELMKWLKDNACPWNEHACSYYCNERDILMLS